MGTSGGVRPMFWQGATDWRAVTGVGTATEGTVNASPYWELADGDAICSEIIVPHGYGLAEPHLVFHVPTANAGNLSLRLRIRAIGFLQQVTKAYDTDETLTTSTHPQNVPLPLVYADIAVAGRTFEARIDRVAAGLAGAVRIHGINWETTG